MSVSKQQALDYHYGSRPGKIEVTPTWLSPSTVRATMSPSTWPREA